MKNILIIGDGGWGTALGLLLMRQGHHVRIWGPFPDYIEQMRLARVNDRYLPGVVLPEEMELTADRDEAVAGVGGVILAVPSKFCRAVFASFAGRLPKHCLLLSVCKGLDSITCRRITDIAADILGHAPVSVLSGPSHAEEVARGLPTAVVLSSADAAHARSWQRVLSGKLFRVYTSDDVVGVELGGALKNIMAIAAGVSDGLGLGDNARAALMTRGLAEMTRIGVAMGARPETFAGLSGIGDLMVTCGSRLSRNHAVGERLGRGETMEQILAGMQQVAEGVTTCAIAREVAHAAKIRVPITDQIHAVLNEGKKPALAVEELMNRLARSERD